MLLGQEYEGTVAGKSSFFLLPNPDLSHNTEVVVKCEYLAKNYNLAIYHKITQNIFLV